MKDERAEFAERLKSALREAGVDDGPSALMKRFNARYHGASVSSQVVSQWLAGKVRPRQEKVRVLAELLDVDLHWLQSGEGRAGTLRQRPPAWPEAVSADERRAIEAYLRLPDDARRLVAQLIFALAQSPPREPGKR